MYFHSCILLLLNLTTLFIVVKIRAKKNLTRLKMTQSAAFWCLDVMVN